MRKVFDSMNASIESGGTKLIFDHIRNYLYASLFFAAGSFAVRETDTALLGLVQGEHLGWGVMLIGVVLWLINF